MTFETKLWTLECTQGFSKIWPSKLVFDLTWSSFELDLDTMRIKILTKFPELWITIVPSRVYTRFFCKIWPRDLVFDPTWPSFELDLDFMMIDILTCFMNDGSTLCLLVNDGSTLCLLECTQGFSKIWPSDLVFDPTWPSFEADLDIIMVNILTKFHELWIKTVPSRMYTRFFLKFDLAT